MAGLELRKLQVTIGGKRVCNQLDLSVEPGQCWAVLGANGVGKTTLLHTLAGLRAPASGTILLDSRDMTGLARKSVARRLGVLFQERSAPFPTTVLETALIGRHPYLSRWDWEGAEDIERARAALAATDLAGLEARQIDTLSGGEQQRLALATVLTQDPDVLLLDEPTNHLDLHHKFTILGLLQGLAGAQAKSVLLTLHDVNLAARFCDHLLLLFGDGESLGGPTSEVLTLDNLERLYHHPMRQVADDGRVAFLPD